MAWKQVDSKPLKYAEYAFAGRNVNLELYPFGFALTVDGKTASTASGALPPFPRDYLRSELSKYKIYELPPIPRFKKPIPPSDGLPRE
jgi:hypothetical protein